MWDVDHKDGALGSNEHLATRHLMWRFHSPQHWQWHRAELSPPHPVSAIALELQEVLEEQILSKSVQLLATNAHL